MNYNTKNIIHVYASITGNENLKDIDSKLMKSETYREVKRGNSVYICQGYTANLIEIVDELKEQENCPREVFEITTKTVSIVNRARRNENFLKKRTLMSPFKRFKLPVISKKIV